MVRSFSNRKSFISDNDEIESSNLLNWEAVLIILKYLTQIWRKPWPEKLIQLVTPSWLINNLRSNLFDTKFN